jgi:cytochrome c5
VSYYDVSQLSTDTAFISRCSACYAIESAGAPGAKNPSQWAMENCWALAAQPGFGDAYGYAIANGNTEPGKDPAVITDAQILAAVQSIGV